MIQLSNGHKMKYLIASGAMGYYGNGWGFKFWEHPLRWVGSQDLSKFTIVTKTITYNERKGNGFFKVRVHGDSILNAQGMPNIGFHDWYVNFNKSKIKNDVIVSIYERDQFRISEIIALLCMTPLPYSLKGVEFNVDCPNAERLSACEIVMCIDKIYEYCEHCLYTNGSEGRLPVGLKLNCSREDISFLKDIEDKVEWININSVPWNYLYTQDSIFYKYGNGAISGEKAQQSNWNFLEKLKSTTSIPVVAPSIVNYYDMYHLKERYNPDAYAFGSIFMKHPCKANTIINKFEKEFC